MELRSDIVCKGSKWKTIGEKLGYAGKENFFDKFWSSFKLCMAIGILYDGAIDDEDIADDSERMTLPRTMFNSHSSEVDFFFQSAILTSSVVELSEKDRLYLAFSEDVLEEELNGEDAAILQNGVSEQALKFDRVKFLKKFANYGAEKLYALISNNDSETMDNLITFLIDSYNGDTDELIEKKKVPYLLDE